MKTAGLLLLLLLFLLRLAPDFHHVHNRQINLKLDSLNCNFCLIALNASIARTKVSDASN